MWPSHVNLMELRVTEPNQLKEIKMSGPNFGAVLDKPSAEIERPKPMPIGTYIWAIVGMPRMDKSSKKQTEFVEFTAKPLQAMEDVDRDELKEMGGLEDKTQRLTFYLTEASVYRLKEFLFDDLGLEDDGGPLRGKLEQTAGCQFAGVIKHTPSDDGKSVYANIASTSALEG